MGVAELVIVLAVLAVLLALIARTRSGSRPPRPVVLPSVPLPAELQSHLRAMTGQGQRIQAVRTLREATGLSLLDAKNVVDAIAAGRSLPTPAGDPGGPRADLAYRARTLAAAGREDEAVRVVAAETGMSAPEATAFVRALQA